MYLAVYVVFGAAGAVGKDLVSRLAKQSGAKVVASDRDEKDIDRSSSVIVQAADTQDEESVRFLRPQLDHSLDASPMQASVYVSKGSQKMILYLCWCR